MSEQDFTLYTYPNICVILKTVDFTSRRPKAPNSWQCPALRWASLGPNPMAAVRRNSAGEDRQRPTLEVGGFDWRKMLGVHGEVQGRWGGRVQGSKNQLLFETQECWSGEVRCFFMCKKPADTEDGGLVGLTWCEFRCCGFWSLRNRFKPTKVHSETKQSYRHQVMESNYWPPKKSLIAMLGI